MNIVTELVKEQEQAELEAWSYNLFSKRGTSQVLQKCAAPFSSYIDKIIKKTKQDTASTRTKELGKWIADSKLSAKAISCICLQITLDLYYSQSTFTKSFLEKRIERTLREEARLRVIALNYNFSRNVGKYNFKPIIDTLKKFPQENTIEEPEKILSQFSDWLVHGLLQGEFLIYNSAGRLKLGNELSAYIKKYNNKSYYAAHAPVSLTPPIDWTTPFDGGYRTQLRFTITKQDRSLLEKNFCKSKIPMEYECINNLQSIPYKINQFVSDLLKKILDAGIIKNYIQIKESRYREEKEVVTKITHDVAVALEKIKKIDSRIFYLVWGLDYRGRKYSKGSLSYQRSDWIRSLFLFSKEKPITVEGSSNMAIHGASLFGLKGTTTERMQWAMTHSKQIVESAKNPLDFEWWLQADEPFQFIAFCNEWRGFTEEGFQYKTALPIQIDGSCNSLQHYAALFKNPRLARASHLSTRGEFKDFYAHLEKRLIRWIEKDAKQCAQYAEYWETAPLSRGDVKSVFMIKGFGGTNHGVKDFLLKVWFRQNREFNRPKRYAKYIGYIMSLLDDLYAEELPEVETYNRLITDGAKESRVTQGNISWVGQTGLTIDCNITKDKESIVSYTRGRKMVFDSKKRPDIAKQARVVPPNLIHSLDAIHMTLTVNSAFKEGIQVISLHDGFITHAGDVSRMKKLLKTNFVEMYSKDVLSSFGKDLGVDLSKIDNGWDIKETLTSENAFS